MSGLFRSFSRLIDQGAFAQKGNSYILQVNPIHYSNASLRINRKNYDFSKQAERDHHSNFTLAEIVFGLKSQINLYNDLIKNGGVSGASSLGSKEIPRKEIILQHYQPYLLDQIKFSFGDQPAQTCSKALNVIASIEELSQQEKKEYQDIIEPVFEQKLDYASQENLFQFLEAQSNLKHKNNSLISKVKARIQQEGQLQPVTLFGNTVNVYELNEDLNQYNQAKGDLVYDIYSDSKSGKSFGFFRKYARQLKFQFLFHFGRFFYNGTQVNDTIPEFFYTIEQKQQILENVQKQIE